MNEGKYIFSQLFEIIYWYDFDLCVKRYRGNGGVKSFTCWEQFLVMSFAQFSYTRHSTIDPERMELSLRNLDFQIKNKEGDL